MKLFHYIEESYPISWLSQIVKCWPKNTIIIKMRNKYEKFHNLNMIHYDFESACWEEFNSRTSFVHRRFADFITFSGTFYLEFIHIWESRIRKFLQQLSTLRQPLENKYNFIHWMSETVSFGTICFDQGLSICKTNNFESCWNS